MRGRFQPREANASAPFWLKVPQLSERRGSAWRVGMTDAPTHPALYVTYFSVGYFGLSVPFQAPGVHGAPAT